MIACHQHCTVRLSFPSNGASLFARSARVFWRRQIAPAPASASFNDMPTMHPFFNEVEQLARSAFTLGCGGGNFCPDAMGTRGQMMMVLSCALALHWDLTTNVP